MASGSYLTPQQRIPRFVVVSYLPAHLPAHTLPVLSCPWLSLLLAPLQNSPAIRVLASDGHTHSEQPGDGAGQVLGSCYRDFRNQPHPFRARITYLGQRLRNPNTHPERTDIRAPETRSAGHLHAILTPSPRAACPPMARGARGARGVSGRDDPPTIHSLVSLNSGLTPRDPDEVCVDVGPLRLVPGGFFGVSAATDTLADDHDVLSFLTFSLREPGPEVPPHPFLEMEQLHLERQLEGLRARLGLGTREDVTPKSDSEAQEDGERLFDLEETLDRHGRTLQALQGLSERLAQAERQWKQLGPPGQARPDGGWVGSEKRGAVSWALDKKLALLQDSAKLSALLQGQWTLLQALQRMRDAAVRMATEAQVSYLPVGTEHHFLELDHILGLLQKELRGLASPTDSAPAGPWSSLNPIPNDQRRIVWAVPKIIQSSVVDLGPLDDPRPQAFPAVPTDAAMGAEKAAAKAPCPPSRPPRASSCLQPGIFLFFLLIQTVGFFGYVHFRRGDTSALTGPAQSPNRKEHSAG
ncbi:hypothetical protein P7K49_017219 [Saguinus oedipus]|uniref:L-type lectin-like domain-containing protein n=1 Tax=Saguinus oedipus TaxID=9490 RepID=A0ABQ9V1W8_SAGOE|nr:hypothetical protein P7K49_017219 [Saguinus oedipus]